MTRAQSPFASTTLLHPRTDPLRTARGALLELWLDIEPFLTSDERASLGGPSFERVFPPDRPTRDGPPRTGALDPCA